MTAYDIETKVESAYVNYLGPVTGLAQYYGLESARKELPGVHSYCHDAIEDPLGSGSYRCMVDVVVVRKAVKDVDEDPDPLIEFRAMLHAVRAALKWTDIDEKLSAAEPDFSVLTVIDRGGGTVTDDSNFVATIRQELHVLGRAGA